MGTKARVINSQLPAQECLVVFKQAIEAQSKGGASMITRLAGNNLEFFEPTVGPEIRLEMGDPAGVLGAYVPRMHGGLKGAKTPVRCVVWDRGDRRDVHLEVDGDMYSSSQTKKLIQAVETAFAQRG